MNKKHILLVFVPGYLPGYKLGGPLRTIANMVEQLSDELDFRIITADRDSFDTEPYPNVIVDGWNSVGKAKVYYASPSNRSLGKLARLINEIDYDVLYLNSFFHPVFTLRPLTARLLGRIQRRPTVIAPRGEFSRGALALKCLKKRSYIAFVKAIGLYQNLTWQASSDYEAEDILKALGSTAKRIVVAPNLPSILDFRILEERPNNGLSGGPFRICFLSRITPMKNLDFALRVLAKIMVPVDLSVYGVIDDESYWQKCKNIIRELPRHVTVRYHGVIKHEEVAIQLAGHDLFFLPTRGENFGHVIHEALASGLPVLISDKTPWRNLEEHGVGWALSLDKPEKFIRIIEAMSSTSIDIRTSQKSLAIKYANRTTSEKEVLSSNIAMFTDLIRVENIMPR